MGLYFNFEVLSFGKAKDCVIGFIGKQNGFVGSGNA